LPALIDRTESNRSPLGASRRRANVFASLKRTRIRLLSRSGPRARHHHAMSEDEAQQQLEETAEFWRTDIDGTEAEASANEVADGAERAAQQPDFGREGQ
jgi:hypothetical protein